MIDGKMEKDEFLTMLALWMGTFKENENAANNGQMYCAGMLTMAWRLELITHDEHMDLYKKVCDAQSLALEGLAKQ